MANSLRENVELIQKSCTIKCTCLLAIYRTTGIDNNFIWSKVKK